jgi:hypothetical protein
MTAVLPKFFIPHRDVVTHAGLGLKYLRTIQKAKNSDALTVRRQPNRTNQSQYVDWGT